MQHILEMESGVWVDKPIRSSSSLHWKKNPVALEDLANEEIEKKSRKSQMLSHFRPVPNQVASQEADGTAVGV
jgi:hypothetical protein